MISIQYVLYSYDHSSGDTMTRPPKARLRILDAAERIVKERGAANLTYEELVLSSGVSRGGITYHFATKDDLLRALIERDIEQWQEREQQCRISGGCDRSADLIAELRSFTEPNPEKRRFVAGMMSAVAHDRSLLEPVRRLESERFPAHWSHVEIDRQLLKLSAIGLFWSEVFGCTEFPPAVRDRLVERLESLARDWSAQTSVAAPGSSTVSQDQDNKES